MTYIKLFVDYLEALEPLGDAEKGRLFTALLEYARTGEAPQLCGNERFLFPMMRAQIDRDKAEYRGFCEKQADNGRKGGRPMKNPKNPPLSEKPTAFFETQKSKDKDKDKDKDKEEKTPMSDAANGVAGPGKPMSFSHDGEAYQAAVYLARQIQQRLGGRKSVGEKRLQSWADALDKCQRLDGHDWEEIGRVLRFSQRDAFWQTVILSGGKFREKYIQLLAKMRVCPEGRSRGENKSYDIDELEAMSRFDLPENL